MSRRAAAFYTYAPVLRERSESLKSWAGATYMAVFIACRRQDAFCAKVSACPMRREDGHESRSFKQPLCGYFLCAFDRSADGCPAGSPAWAVKVNRFRCFAR